MKHTFLLAIVICFCISVSAQDNIFTIDTVQVISTRMQQKTAESGRYVQTIEAEAIKNLPVTSIDELLKYIPGIEVQSRGMFGTQGDISMRGATFSQVLVVIDGVKLNDPLTGHFNSNIPISMIEIDRIEILHGPATIQFGADAVGGVIHILTRTYMQKDPTSTKDIQLKAGYGEYGLLTTDNGIFAKKRHMTASLGVQTSRADGQQLKSGGRSDFDVKTISGSLGFDLPKGWHLMLRSGLDQRNFNAKYFYTRSTFDQSREETGNFWNHIKLFKNIGPKTTDIDVAYKRNTDYYLFNPAFTPANEHTTQLITIQGNHNYRLNEKITLGGGVQSEYRTVLSNDRGNHEDMHVGLFLQSAYKPMTKLAINAGIRLDNDENYGTEISPQISASYSLNKTIIRSSFGRSIRAADYTERYISTLIPFPLSGGRNLGNPNLKAEKSNTIDLGIDHYLSKHTKVSITGFMRDSENVIDYILTKGAFISDAVNIVENNDYFYASNIAEVKTVGIESNFIFRKELLPQMNLDLNLGYTFLNTETDTVLQVAKYINSHAKHLVHGSMFWNTPVANISINGLWKERTAEFAKSINSEITSSYFVWNLRMDLRILESDIFLSGEIRNVGDIVYADILGAELPGRWAMIGFNYKPGR